MRSAWAVAIKELRQIRRDRRTLTILIFVPTFFLFLYGYALNFDIRHVAMAIEDRDDSLKPRQRGDAFPEQHHQERRHADNGQVRRRPQEERRPFLQEQPIPQQSAAGR